MLEAIAIALYTTNPWAVLGVGFTAGVAAAITGSKLVERARRPELSGVANG